jgi:hypothetical protein
LGGTADADSSWLTFKGIQDKNQYILYLYSFYFCTTTILTVGYGDITPQNPTEVMVVVIVQVLGNLSSI